MKLEADDIGVAPGGTTLLSHVSFTVGSGECVALIGPNGVGKSSLLRVLAGIDAPEGGRVRVDGDDLALLARREIARRLSFMLPNSRPAFEFSCSEYVLMGLVARQSGFGFESKRDRERALEAMRTMGVDDLAGSVVSRVSTGERQLLTMARTMIAETGLWLLDEPTANLDRRFQTTLLEQLRGHASGEGAVLAVVHDLNLLPHWFDRAILLHAGSVLADGPPLDVLTDDVLSAAYQVQIERRDAGDRVVFVS